MLTCPASVSAAEWETGIAGAWSVSAAELPARNAYTSNKQNLRFIDFGGVLHTVSARGLLDYILDSIHRSVCGNRRLRKTPMRQTLTVAKTAEIGLRVCVAMGTHPQSEYLFLCGSLVFHKPFSARRWL
jgi:hypothetical protein